MYVVKYPEGYSLTWSATGTVSINSSSTYFEDVDSITKRLYVVTNNNTSRNTLTSTITVTGTKDGDTLVGTATLTKNGTPGSISISPSSKTVNPTSGTVTYDVTCVDMNLSTLRTNVYDSTMNNVTASINSAGTVLTVNYGANTATSSKSASISVYGNDIYGFGKSAGVTLNQKASVTVSLSPSTKTIGNTEQTADFAVSCSPSGATLSYNVASGGTLGIDTTRTGFITSGGTKYLRVYTNANTSTSTQSASITVTGTYDGVTGTSSAVTLSKQGVPGTITLDPTTATINAAAGTLTVGVTPFNMNTSSITFSVASGNLTISSVSFNSTKTQATISYAANTSTTSEKSGVITIYGNDVYGARASANITITQKKAVPTITVTPSSGTLTATESPIVYVVSYPSGYTNLNYTTSGDISIDRTEFETVDSTTSRF